MDRTNEALHLLGANPEKIPSDGAGQLHVRRFSLNQVPPKTLSKSLHIFILRCCPARRWPTSRIPPPFTCHQGPLAKKQKGGSGPARPRRAARRTGPTDASGKQTDFSVVRSSQSRPSGPVERLENGGCI